MTNKYLRLTLAISVVLGIALLANGHVAWAGTSTDVAPAALGQGESSVLLAGLEPGSVKPPPPGFNVCEDGLYSVGGVVVMDIKDLKPGYCVETELWSPFFPVHPIQADAGMPLAHFLFLRIYFTGDLMDDLPVEDGSIEACYALPPEKQAQFYFYDFYWEKFQKRIEPPVTWELVDTRADAEEKTACAFVRVSGVYGLMGK